MYVKNLLHICGLFLFVSLFTAQAIFAQDAMTRNKINELIDRHFANEAGPFNWKTTDARTRWSAAILSDSLISVGYCPAGMDRFEFKKNIGNFDFTAPEWENIRKDLVNTTLASIEALNPEANLDFDYIFPYGTSKPLPYVTIRIWDLSIVETLMAREDIRFVEPMGYTPDNGRSKSGAGCGDYVTASINPADLVGISGACNSVRSWHHDPHNVPCAWSNGWTGQGIGMAVLDSGVSDNQSQLTMPDFAECESAGRTFNKTGFYTDAPSGSDDCGHGTSMSGLAAAPWGDDGTPVGIAYKTNFTSYRVAENVLLDTSDEADATADAYTAAANDPNIKITSMSLGWIASNGVIETAIIYAHSQDLMMFCAAGTSTGFTNWYPVIFPAWMPETVACTGVNDAAIGARNRCETCHDGPEVDFVAVMERASDDSRKAVSLGMPDLSSGYVGGSSASTASLAGMAAVIWSANPTESRQQIYNRMAQSADYYPGRDDNFGWGKVDVCKAADPNFAAPCDPTLANSSVTIEITNISFPNSDDGFGGENEWVIEIAGQSYFFNVSDSGDSGAPSIFHDNGECGSMPMIINMGATNCGQSSINISVSSHEDDSTFSNCTLNGGDDHAATQSIPINFTSNTFTHTSSAGSFVFTFSATCSPASTPAVSVGGLARICEGDTPPDVTFNFAGGTAPYTATYNINGGSAQSITTVGGSTSATVPVSTATAGTYTYNVTEVSDALGCSTQTGTYTIEVVNNCVLEIVPRVYLQGPIDMAGTPPLMGDDLRANGMIPLSDPYGLGGTTTAAVLAATGNDAIVDWVMVELRDGATNTAVLATVAGLLQRDGDIVSPVDGVSPLEIPYGSSGNFHIAVHHRNHLAVMTNTPVPLFPSQQ